MPWRISSAPAAGPRPVIAVHAFDATHDAEPVLTTGSWQITSVLVDHHPVEPAVGYLVEHPETRVAVSGDTAVCEGMRILAQGVDVLVHEALLTSRVRPALLEWNAGARSVGELAAHTHPHTLVLTHLIPAPDTADDEHAYIDEVRAGGFDGTTLIARDGLRL